jgi:hypothetical protein
MRSAPPDTHAYDYHSNLLFQQLIFHLISLVQVD